MAKKYFLSILALMFCFNAFSQQSQSLSGEGTEAEPYLIQSLADFNYFKQSGDKSKYYKQTADIDLGDRGTINSAIISTEFSGTYDGGGYTIKYLANFNASTSGSKYGLFQEVSSSGVIKNLNIDANASISGNASDVKMGLLCGFVNGGLIEYCNVKTEITSTVSPGIMGNAGTGLIAGRCDGTIQYCTGTGAVVGSGYVGGLVGQMGYLKVEWGWWIEVNHYGGGTIKGCSFSGSVTAQEGGAIEGLGDLNAVAGGLCGLVTNDSQIISCCVDAIVNSDNVAMGAGATTKYSPLLGMTAGTPTISNNYCTGSVKGNTINEKGEITNSNNASNNNYTTNSSSTVGTLNDNKNDNNIRFETVNGEVVLIIGQQGEVAVCVAPTNLQITQGQDGNHTATWDFEGSATFLYTLSGGVYNSPLSGTTTDKTVSTGEPLTPSPNPYVFTVKTKCGEDNFSEEISQSFIVECPKPTNLSVSNISYNSITVTYIAPAKSKLTVGSTEIVSENAGEITKTITGLTPETEYEVRVEVMCGSEYEESLSTNITTTAIPAPTGLAVSTAYDGSTGKGSATITWNMVDGLTYEIEGQQGDKTSEYTIDNLAIGNYTLRLRAKLSSKTSAWVEMPYTISSPEAPYNPQVKYTQDGDTYDVTITWQKGATGDVQGWKVNGGNIQTTQTFTLENQNQGTSTNVSIVEYVNASTFSEALIVPIQVPCLSATLPTDVSTTQTTATFTFANENSNRKIVIGSNEYDADDASVTISNLNTATNYNYSVVEYCTQTLYSEESGTFATKSCYAVSNLQARATGMTTATASWESQSGGGLKFNVILLNGATEVVNIDTTATTYDFTGLHTATTYTLKVSEQCGVGYGEVRTINFTTESSEYTTKQSGDFNTSATWVNNRVPKGNTANITIGSGHEITISHTLTITDSYKIVSNQGVLQITQQGELINTTNTNVGGIVEIVTPQKTINQWTFIGAPFTKGYKLETVVPAQNDISVSKFDYSSGQWSNGWATIETEMEAGEGMFAWLFYSGLVTFTTYGDKGTFTSEYNFNNPPATALNNDTVITVAESLTTSSGGNWMALANPYPFKLNVATFLSDNTLSETNPNPGPNSNTTIQGEVIYKFDSISWTTHNSGEILMTEGFFVNFANAGNNTATFKKTQRLANQSKSAITPREFVKLALVDGKKEIDLLFAHNEKSENSYDIFDANKMFSPIEIAEPYFVTGGFDLVKEEVKELPYYATMNVRSYKDTVMSFVMKSIPEGLKVSIIDGENVINMYEGSVYTTEFLKGENEDRFKLYVRKADRLEEVRGRSVSITNCNRLVNVQSKEKDLTMDVFNAVGQIVYSTTEYNFNLASLPAGTYIVMAHNKRVNERVKIVIN